MAFVTLKDSSEGFSWCTTRFRFTPNFDFGKNVVKHCSQPRGGDVQLMSPFALIRSLEVCSKNLTTEGSSSHFQDVPSTNTSSGLFPLPKCFGSISSLVSKSLFFSRFNKIPMTRVHIFNFLCPIQTLAHSPPPSKPLLRTLNSSILH